MKIGINRTQVEEISYIKKLLQGNRSIHQRRLRFEDRRTNDRQIRDGFTTHPVISEEKDTMLRVVFDSAAKTDEVSLLEKEPNI